jgi:SAM-dependent methyltransferase
LAERARELNLVDPQVEEGEGRWREMTAGERLADLRRFITGGRLLEVGCSGGELLAAAGAFFLATGVEADAASSCLARARGLDCRSGTLFDARFPEESFDAAALYHVIEHLPSPRLGLGELRRVLRPGGWLVVETPNIATPWFRLLGPRWRQLIPDHRFFFTPETITRLCAKSGFEVCELRSVGKAMSVRLFLSRLGRYHRSLARALGVCCDRLNLSERTLRLNLGDVMRVYARRRP